MALLTGGFAVLCAPSGLTLVFGLMHVVNMSHGIFLYGRLPMPGLWFNRRRGNWVIGIAAGGRGYRHHCRVAENYAV